MKYCPKCHKEYGNGYEMCSECMVELIDGENEEVLLASYSFEEEALVIEGLLKSIGIPYIRRYDKFGDYLKITTGTTRMGISIYVAEKDYEFAKEILNSEHEFSEELLEEDEDKEMSIDNREQKDDDTYNTMEIGHQPFSFFSLFFLLVLIVLLLLGRV